METRQELKFATLRDTLTSPRTFLGHFKHHRGACGRHPPNQLWHRQRCPVGPVQRETGKKVVSRFGVLSVADGRQALTHLIFAATVSLTVPAQASSCTPEGEPGPLQRQVRFSTARGATQSQKLGPSTPCRFATNPGKTQFEMRKVQLAMAIAREPFVFPPLCLAQAWAGPWDFQKKAVNFIHYPPLLQLLETPADSITSLILLLNQPPPLFPSRDDQHRPSLSRFLLPSPYIKHPRFDPTSARKRPFVFDGLRVRLNHPL